MQLLRDCLPPQIWRLLLSEDPTPHKHRSLIINLACGATINNEASRFKLYEGYVSPPSLPNH